MITKFVNGRNQRVLVTFELPSVIWADQIALVGDFNDWNPTIHVLIQSRDNENWHITLALEPNRAYRFRYLIDGQTWCSDPGGDDYTSTEDGIPCSVIMTALA